MKKATLLLSVIASTLISANLSYACSNVFLSGPGNAAVARTMDLEMNTGDSMGFGGKGWHNTSNINAVQAEPVNALQWKNKYAFLGQTGFKTYVILDGINTAGLYASFLDLPNITLYPVYNAKDPRPELGLTDLVDYVLATSSTVPDALTQLHKAQIVENAFSVSYQGKHYFAGNAVHLVMRDREGNSAIIEWTANKQHQSEMHIYEHKASTQVVVETVNGKVKVYKDSTAAVVTNSPNYGWQLNNAARYNYVYTGNSNQQWDDLYMNGSGLTGLPGDWTPPSRFARAAQLARLTPTPQTEPQALSLVYGILSSAMRVPIGSNSAASIWVSVSDLKNNIYYFKPYMSVTQNPKTNTSYVTPVAFNDAFKAYDLNKMKKLRQAPSGWVSAQVKIGPKADAEQIRVANKMSYAPTSGKMKYTFILK